MEITQHISIAIKNLKDMISIPSYSFNETEVSDMLHKNLAKRAGEYNCIDIERVKNNILLYKTPFNPNKQTLMLCAHIDTVEPSEGYTYQPHTPTQEDGKIYGLGSNDDGGSVVCMIETFFALANRETEQNITPDINLILALTAEEERSGPNGMDLVTSFLQNKSIKTTQGETMLAYPNLAIVGEPTQMKGAVAERGLLVIDATAQGISGHAARNEGVNALYIAIEDIAKIKDFKLPKISPLMGEVKITVTQLNCGTAHNVVPDKATFVIDIRPTEQYSNLEILEILQGEVKSELKARNLKNRASATPLTGALGGAIDKCKLETYISPTTSDWMRLQVPAIKMGPGDSARSHRANEYITINEIREGIEGYINFIDNIK